MSKKAKITPKRDRYRESVICILRHENRVLLCHKPTRAIDDWGLPGGGTKPGETINQTAQRELQEELGLQPDDYRIDSVSRNRHSYEWSEAMVKKTGFVGQKQHLVKATISPGRKLSLQSDDELDGFVWVLVSDLGFFIDKPELRQLIEKEMI